MSITVSWNTSDTSATAVGTAQPATLNYQADWAKETAVAGSATIVNLTAPVDRKEKLRFATSRIANVYSGTDISPAYYSQNRTGMSLLTQLTTTVTVTDSDSNQRTDLPLSAHIVLKVPNNAAISGEVLRTLVLRLVGALYEQSGVTMDARLNALFHGATLPTAIA